MVETIPKIFYQILFFPLHLIYHYDNISLCLQNSKTFENIKKCYTDFIVYLIILYPKDQEKTFAPKILEDTLKTINEKTDVESIKKEMEKIFHS